MNMLHKIRCPQHLVHTSYQQCHVAQASTTLTT